MSKKSKGGKFLKSQKSSMITAKKTSPSTTWVCDPVRVFFPKKRKNGWYSYLYTCLNMNLNVRGADKVLWTFVATAINKSQSLKWYGKLRNVEGKFLPLGGETPSHIHIIVVTWRVDCLCSGCTSSCPIFCVTSLFLNFLAHCFLFSVFVYSSIFKKKAQLLRKEWAI